MNELLDVLLEGAGSLADTAIDAACEAIGSVVEAIGSVGEAVTTAATSEESARAAYLLGNIATNATYLAGTGTVRSESGTLYGKPALTSSISPSLANLRPASPPPTL